MKKHQLLMWQCYYYNNSYILWLKREHRSISNILLVITSPIILFWWIISVIAEKTFGTLMVKRIKHLDSIRSFKSELTICAIGKNEGGYISEWLEYHKLVGVDKVVFFDNDSDDNTVTVLEPYIKEGYVDYYFVKGVGKQLYSYEMAIKKYKDYSRWIAFIDLDEFIQPLQYGQKIPEILEKIFEQSGTGAVGVGVNWCVYGSSGFEHRPKGLTIQNYVYRGENRSKNAHIKTICNPRMVNSYISPHYPIYKLGGYNVNCYNGNRQWLWFCDYDENADIRLVHYRNRSKEEFLMKRARGLGDREGLYDLTSFQDYDFNDVKDLTMLRYVEQIKLALNTKG